ncbi:MAG: hypothetical protein SOV36_06000 [Anaerostipes faecalis]|nr:hypothetical protein [Anaerostipes faecalis]
MYQWRVSIPHLIYAPRGCAGIRIGSMSAMQTRIPRQDSRASLEYYTRMTSVSSLRVLNVSAGRFRSVMK